MVKWVLDSNEGEWVGLSEMGDYLPAVGYFWVNECWILRCLVKLNFFFFSRMKPRGNWVGNFAEKEFIESDD